MEQKKKKEEDVLVVRDEKTGEISVVAGLDARGYPKRAQAKAEHSQEFLRFDRHGDMIDNFFRNFYRQCKEPTRFGFYRIAADTADALLPVIRELLKDPKANAELLAPHKVDTSAYQQQAEAQTEGQMPKTEEVKRENAEDVEQKADEATEKSGTAAAGSGNAGGTGTGAGTGRANAGEAAKTEPDSGRRRGLEGTGTVRGEKGKPVRKGHESPDELRQDGSGDGEPDLRRR